MLTTLSNDVSLYREILQNYQDMGEVWYGLVASRCGWVSRSEEQLSPGVVGDEWTSDSRQPAARNHLLHTFHLSSLRLPQVEQGFAHPRDPPMGGRLTLLDASFARCFSFWRTSSKTSTSMFFQKHRQNIASLRKKHDVLHDVFVFRNSIQSYDKSLVI